MTTLEIWLLAISLAMDCFSVSITSGIILRRICMRTFLTMAFFFGLFQGVMPLIGWFGASRFFSLIENFDHWIAFVLLGIIGINMIRESRDNDEDCDACPDFSIRSMFMLAIATSIDALAIGISFAFLQVKIWSSASIIGITTFILSMIGLRIGNIFGCRYKSKAEFAGGVVLIIIGIKILAEHILS